MKKVIISLICLSVAAPLLADGTNSFPDEKSKVSYAIGMMLGQNFFKRNGLTTNDVDLNVAVQGMKAEQVGTPALLTDDEMKETVQAFQKEFAAKQQALRDQEAVKNKKDGEAFLAANKNNPGVQILPVTGRDGVNYDLQYIVITNGAGATPTANDEVTVNYRGTLIDGTEFDSSYKRGQPATFHVGGVIPGWTAALQKMSVGSKWKLFIPSELAYGERGNRGIEPNQTLIFEVELLDVKAAPAPPAQPAFTPPAPPAGGKPAPSAPPLTSDIIKVPSAEEMKKGAKIETIKPEDVSKYATNSMAK